MGETKNEVAVKDEKKFDLVTLSAEMAEGIAEEMDGLGQIPFDRVKIPSGGGLSFEIPGEDEENPESAPELVGVILHHHPVNTYWKEAFSGANEQPDCSSIDGKTGVDRETGEIKSCAECPYNQFGSDGQGKACKNVHRVYLLREGNPIPVILSLPPTSLKSLRDYIGKRVLVRGLRSYQVITKITLKKEKNAAGIAYSRAVFTMVDKLSEDQMLECKKMSETIKAQDISLEPENEDYSAPAEPASDDGFMNIPEGTQEALPFE